MSNTARQNVEHMSGEVAFRRKLAKQHVDGETILPDYFTKEEADEVLRVRLRDTTATMAALRTRGICLSPFIELGAERGQRSLAMVNDLDAVGFAVDISYDQLRTATHYANLFGKPKIPYRVCCDANHLPFKKGSIPFVFCYEFLHHFPSPAPVIRDIYEVLSDGYFFFNEEPLRKPKIPLYTQKRKPYSVKQQKKNAIVRFLEGFISEEYCDEREHGVLENDNISLKEWVDALSVFASPEVEVSSLRGKVRSRLGTRVGLRNLPNMLLGGGLRGLCAKQGQGSAPAITNVLDALTCPDCRVRSSTVRLGQEPSLARERDQLRCEACCETFPVVDGVMVILPKELLVRLYPEFC